MTQIATLLLHIILTILLVSVPGSSTQDLRLKNGTPIRIPEKFSLKDQYLTAQSGLKTVQIQYIIQHFSVTCRLHYVQRNFFRDRILIFMSKNEDENQRAIPATEQVTSIQPPSHSEKNTTSEEQLNEVIEEVFDYLHRSADADTRIISLPDALVRVGVFDRVAILSIADDRQKATVIKFCGEEPCKLCMMILDQKSPLLKGQMSVHSAGSFSDECSPYNSPSFAIAPLNHRLEGDLWVYGDCNDEPSIPFASRRIFREVVNSLNKSLEGTK